MFCQIYSVTFFALPRFRSTRTFCQIYYVTLSALPRFGCLTRFSGTFQLCRVPGVLGGGRHNCLLFSLQETVSNRSVTLFQPWTLRPDSQSLTALGCHREGPFRSPYWGKLPAREGSGCWCIRPSWGRSCRTNPHLMTSPFPLRPKPRRPRRRQNTVLILDTSKFCSHCNPHRLIIPIVATGPGSRTG